MENRPKLFRAECPETGEITFGSIVKETNQFGEEMVRHLSGVLYQFCNATDADLQSLAVALATSSPEMTPIVRAVSDLGLRDVDWTQVWSSLQPI